MHKSRLAGFIIDCKTDDLKSAAALWGGALGMEARALPGDEGEKYVQLVDPHDRLHVEVQTVPHASRVHLDIETDDVEAEVRRLATPSTAALATSRCCWMPEMGPARNR